MGKIAEAERDKYSRIWEFESYAQFSPGADQIDMFWQIAKPKSGQSVIDVGAGAGAASAILKARGLQVRAFDLTDQAWTQPDIHLQTGTIWNDLRGGMYDFAYCCDVMEHIPTEYVALSIDRILATARAAFFSVCFLDDGAGRLIGQPLHLTVKPFVWWRDLFRELGRLDEARDQMGQGVFYVRR